MKIIIAGTGALACLFGARLASLADVTLLGTWRAAIDAIRRDGIRVRTDVGEETVSIRATSRPEDCSGADLLLVLVKSQTTSAVAQRCRGILSSTGLALTLQNGLGNKEALAGVFGPDRAAAGVTTLGACVEEPGVIRFGGEGDIWLETHERLAPVTDLLGKAFPSVRVTDDLLALQWGKLVVSSGLNTLTALLGVPNGRLADCAPARETYIQIVRETASIAAACGIRLPFEDAGKRAIDVAMRTAANRSSMLQDISRGAETEIEAITGSILEAAHRTHTAAPWNETMYGLIKAASTLKSIEGEPV